MMEPHEMHDAITDLRVAQAKLEGKVAMHETRLNEVLERLDLSRQERTDQYRDLKSSIENLTAEVGEYRGAFRFGKWAAGILIALGVPAGMLATWGHGK